MKQQEEEKEEKVEITSQSHGRSHHITSHIKSNRLLYTIIMSLRFSSDKKKGSQANQEKKEEKDFLQLYE